jgi:hypothetical protein
VFAGGLLEDLDLAQEAGDKLAFDEMGVDDFNNGNPARADIAREKYSGGTAHAELVVEAIPAFEGFTD